MWVSSPVSGLKACLACLCVVGPIASVGCDDTGPSQPSAGCEGEGSTYPAGTSAGSLTVGSVQRTFRVHVPPGYRKGQPAPVVLMLHGGGGSGEQLQMQSARMDPIADREGFITVYPDGTGALRTWNAGQCCGRAVADGVDDVGFIAALLDHLEGELCTDKRRVFATGMSNGGMLTHRLACELSDRIAAFAPVAGTLGSSCQAARPVPVLHIHGTSDGHVPWNGGMGCGPAGVPFTSVPDTMNVWRTRNACASNTTTYFEQGDGHCTAYAGCQAPVVLCAVEGGGHSWPGGVAKEPVVQCPADGFQSQSFVASELAWQFFEANPRPQ
ncbi:MAG TPA: PHB depolymerase family esterase [Polyangiaceae bacterium]|nr:PHB depolymerase family esterase [Polyangiaceae bacterium]